MAVVRRLYLRPNADPQLVKSGIAPDAGPLVALPQVRRQDRHALLVCHARAHHVQTRRAKTRVELLRVEGDSLDVVRYETRQAGEAIDRVERGLRMLRKRCRRKSSRGGRTAGRAWTASSRFRGKPMSPLFAIIPSAREYAVPAVSNEKIFDSSIGVAADEALDGIDDPRDVGARSRSPGIRGTDAPIGRCARSSPDWCRTRFLVGRMAW